METTTARAQAHTVAAAYAHCLEVARNHYENFPVASRLLPARLRVATAVIYTFARQADDLADEGDAAPAERLAALDAMAAQLQALEQGKPDPDPVFIALGDVIARFGLPLQPFHDLLSAFRQDVTKKRYTTFEELLDYCRRSANPVGRLLLHLHGAATPENLHLSDRICSALQLINFLQDLEQDWVENGRNYLPQDEMARFGVSEAHLEGRQSDEAMRQLMDFQLARARAMMLAGAPLPERLRGRFRWELRLIVRGGLAVLDRLTARENVFDRPRLSRWAALRLLAGACRPITTAGAPNR